MIAVIDVVDGLEQSPVLTLNGKLSCSPVLRVSSSALRYRYFRDSFSGGERTATVLREASDGRRAVGFLGNVGQKEWEMLYQCRDCIQIFPGRM